MSGNPAQSLTGHTIAQEVFMERRAIRTSLAPSTNPPTHGSSHPTHSLTHRTQRPCAVSHGHQAAGAQGPVKHSRRAACPWRGTHFRCCRALSPPQPVGSSEVESSTVPQGAHPKVHLQEPCSGPLACRIPWKGESSSTLHSLHPLRVGWQRWLGPLLCLMFEGKSPGRDRKGGGPTGLTAHLVALLLGNVQVSLAADDRLVEPAQDLECVAQVPASLGLPHAVTNGPGGQEGVRGQLGLAGH